MNGYVQDYHYRELMKLVELKTQQQGNILQNVICGTCHQRRRLKKLHCMRMNLVMKKKNPIFL